MEYNSIGTEKIGVTASLCEPLATYSGAVQSERHGTLFSHPQTHVAKSDIRVVELFAGVGGFRVGFERASLRLKTVWSNQWEPSTKRQDAGDIYRRQFGEMGFCGKDICAVPTSEIPDCDLLCAGFPCQDYSVATTLNRSGGIEGKKGVLWWQIYRILREKGDSKPRFVVLENVDRLLSSPASQRGRDFAIILATLSDLGYIVEWRVVNAAEYGMPQRRKRTYMVAYLSSSPTGGDYLRAADAEKWLLEDGILPQAFACRKRAETPTHLRIEGDIATVSAEFNAGQRTSPFRNTGVMANRQAYTLDTDALYDGPSVTLGDVLIDEADVPDRFFIPAEELPRWEYLKGHKTLKRVNKSTGFEYNYSEGAMSFPDAPGRASRTIITGEGGASPSRFKHVVKTPSGRFRRLTPLELERLDMFPDNHTAGASDSRRAFLLGNALVTGVVERIGVVIARLA